MCCLLPSSFVNVMAHLNFELETYVPNGTAYAVQANI